ncbi:MULTISPECIES: phage tail protein [Pseudomonas]|jgi:phage protein U|uniref:Phage-like tail protein n=1 Tax=Pseudomonas protegens (strain DSM 19095 / LMG 27888 / CFBP 6595 / CHA0) TaxID=1124983 RepID=A0A2C9EJJ3_PSEPH|nr:MULTISPECIES: phage tail protein [Pseudomonas]AGL83827.1 phage-like tail protein [Pseudomonas protegens CHA0]KAF0863950.1 oxidoreductase [Pseudomonas sp. LD120]MBB1614214.1 oxidoreductase [Pseudomonas sp. UMC65]MBB1617590.1 oxidoreductase [Pseudomonas sp. UME65]MBP5108646.1 phage tail protein [Pseudomonas protegens]
MMMALGMFVFSLSTAAYQELQRQTEWRHVSNTRIGAAPARQFVGRGDDSITLPGVILPELAGSVLSLDTLRLMANTGKAWPMVEGSGRIYGLWVIESLSETKTVFFRDGTPRRLEFTLNLKRIDDDRIDLIGAAGSTGVSILRMLL